MLKTLKITVSGSALILALSLIPAGVGMTFGISDAEAQNYKIRPVKRRGTYRGRGLGTEGGSTRRRSTRTRSTYQRRQTCSYRGVRNGQHRWRCWTGSRYVWRYKAATTARRTTRRANRGGVFLSMQTNYGHCRQICRRFGSSCRSSVRWRGSRRSNASRGVCSYRR